MPRELILTATVLKGHRIEVSDPSLVEGKVVRVTIEVESDPSKPAGNRVFGGAKSQLIYMSDDFDEPLDDFKEYS